MDPTNRNLKIAFVISILFLMSNVATFMYGSTLPQPKLIEKEALAHLESHYTVEAWVIHPNGEIVYLGKVENVFTNIGKNWTRNELGDTATASTNVARHISLSESSSTPVATWTILPTEITTGGCDRNSGTFTALAGNGSWKIEYTFSVTASFTIRCTGLHWVATDNSDNNMIAAAAFATPATVASGDSLLTRWSNTVAEA